MQMTLKLEDILRICMTGIQKSQLRSVCVLLMVLEGVIIIIIIIWVRGDMVPHGPQAA